MLLMADATQRADSVTLIGIYRTFLSLVRKRVDAVKTGLRSSLGQLTSPTLRANSQETADRQQFVAAESRAVGNWTRVV
jgi:hypothetical protein